MRARRTFKQAAASAGILFVICFVLVFWAGHVLSNLPDAPNAPDSEQASTIAPDKAASAAAPKSDKQEMPDTSDEPRAPDAIVHYDFGNAIKTQQFREVIGGAEGCLHDGQLALLQQGFRNRQYLVTTPIQWCKGGMESFLVYQEKHPQKEVDGFMTLLSNQQLDRVLADGQ